MENFLSFPSNSMAPATVTVTLLIIMCSFLWLTRNLLAKKKKEAPEAGGAWPLLGHLHLLGGPQPPHIVMGNMADKYIPIFSIKMGIHKTLVVSHWESAKECFTTNDRAFADRPKLLAVELLTYDRAMFGFGSYGNYWRQMRKIATLELLLNHRLEMLRHVRESEMRRAMKELYKAWDRNKASASNNKVLVEMKRWFGDITFNIILRIIVGKSVGYVTTNEERDEEWKQALKDFSHLSGRFVAADAEPFLRCFDIGGYEKAMKNTAKNWILLFKSGSKSTKRKKILVREKGILWILCLILSTRKQKQTSVVILIPSIKP